MGRMLRPGVPATSDSARVHVLLHRVVARGRSLPDQFFISKDWKRRHQSLVERPIHHQRSQGITLPFFNYIINLRIFAQRQILQGADMVSESSSSRMIRTLKDAMDK